jgi:hypothetical protein
MGVEEQKANGLRGTNELLHTIQREFIRNLRNTKFCRANGECFQSVFYNAGSKLEKKRKYLTAVRKC